MTSSISTLHAGWLIFMVLLNNQVSQRKLHPLKFFSLHGYHIQELHLLPSRGVTDDDYSRVVHICTSESGLWQCVGQMYLKN